MSTTDRTRTGTAEPAGSGLSLARMALSPSEAADAIGCSRAFFDSMILPELRVVRRGRRVFVSVRELQRWLEAEAARTL